VFVILLLGVQTGHLEVAGVETDVTETVVEWATAWIQRLKGGIGEENALGK
jgi:hypothetical protein